MKIDTSIGVFPISPTFISKLNLDDSDDLNNNGILWDEFIHGFLAQASRDDLINAPIALFQFVPKSKKGILDNMKKFYFHEDELDDFIKFIIKDKIIVRVDNEHHYPLKCSCRFFRDYQENKDPGKGSKDCFVLDSKVGLLATEGLTFRNYKDELNRIVSEYNNGQDPKNNVELIDVPNFTNRIYLKYRCSYSGFYELVFPIFNENRILGCLLLGQVILDDLSLNKVLENFNSHFESKGITLNKKLLEELSHNVETDFNRYTSWYKRLKNTPSVINNNNDLINLTIFQISSKIEHFEQVIDDIVSLHRHKYISQRFTHIKKFFLNKSQKKENGKTIENGYLELDDLALVIEETLAQVTQEFNNEAGFIRFFGVKDFSNPSKLSLIASSEGRTFNQEFGDYYFDLGLIPSSIIESKITISNFENFDSSCSISREDLDQLKNGLIIEKGLTDFQKNDIIRYYPTLASNITFVFWKRYVNFQSSDIPSSPQFLIFKNAMLDLYTYIASSYATLWASQSEKKLEDAVRISGHESNQIIPTLRDNLIKTFRKDETIKLLDNIRTGALYKRIDDFLINLDLVKFIYERPAYVFMTFNLNSNEFNEVDVISIFKKLRNLYFSKSRRKSKKIDIIDEQGKFIIKADKMLIEHVLNNLVDNAVKYSYRGTKIRLQTRKEKNYNMIHIISYGPRITSGEKIYNLYYREQLNSEGLGIGMYISRKIIKAHNGEINHNSTLLSSYNLACLTSFEQFREKYKLCPSEMSQIDSIIKNAKLLNETTDLDEILSTAPNNKVLYQPDEFTFTLEYKLPTYKNDFFIKIPNLFNS